MIKVAVHNSPGALLTLIPIGPDQSDGNNSFVSEKIQSISKGVNNYMTKKEKRSEVLQIRFTPSEAERIFKWAVESEMDLPDYLRKIVLRGITFRVQVNDPESIDVESITIRKVGDVGEKQRKHGAG